MSKQDQLTISFQSPLQTDDVEGFEIDPLNELTPFERGMHQFAHDRNREITIHIGADSAHIEAFRDIIPMLFEMPKKIAGFMNGQPFSLELPELAQSVRLSPVGQIVDCKLRGFEVGIVKEYTLSKEHTLNALIQFITEFVKQAVSNSYVSDLDAAAFLIPLQHR